MDLDTDVLIIGAGLSGLGFAIQLQKKYGGRSFEIIEKADSVGGTWWVNNYPGCACDVPSHLYSFSWAPNPDWSHPYAAQPEIHAYLAGLARQHDITRHIRFRTAVDRAVWDAQTGTWAVAVRDETTGATALRRCKVLVSAVGSLSVPRECEIPGADAFRGRLFHSARWDHEFAWQGKDVVIIGNGCSATQILPALSAGPTAARSVTQFSRQPHWLAPRAANAAYSRATRAVLRRVPLAQRLYRAWLYAAKEAQFAGYYHDRYRLGAVLRARWAADAAAYIRARAPARYAAFLVPRSEIGCKRRVNDGGYLEALHREGVELVWDDPVVEVVAEGVRTRSGRVVRADAIVLANGFQTKRMLSPMEIIGKGGVSLDEHWDRVSDGVPSSYMGTCVSAAPNFFMMMGPNSVSGHLSVVYTSECQINYALRLMQPVMAALARQRAPPRPWRLFGWLRGAEADVVVVKPEAERRDLATTQHKARALVWASGCTSWAVDEATGRNFAMYPDWQFLFWLRTWWIKRSDFALSTSPGREAASRWKTV